MVKAVLGGIFTQVSAGSSHSCGITISGSIGVGEMIGLVKAVHPVGYLHKCQRVNIIVVD